jgi:hypothetical protein
MMNLEADMREIKQHVIAILKKMDELMYEREIVSLMKLSEKSLSGFFEDEPDIYSIADLKVRYKPIK